MSDNSVSESHKRMTIRLSEGVGYQEIYPYVTALGGRVLYIFKRFPYAVIEIPEDRIEVLTENSAVSECFPDGEVHALEQSLPWGVDRIDAEQVHSNYGITGFGVKVAVVDTGIDTGHPDLKIYGGKSFITSSYNDDNGHGTHVAGTIAALDNGEGVIGVAPDAWLYSLKVLDSSGSGLWSNVAAAIEWCIDNQMDIISMSLGGTSGDSLIKAAVAEAYLAGILLVAAAGNSGNSDGSGDNVLYPAKYPEVIAVAATDQKDGRAPFSSTGPDVELAAPGMSIPSTYLGSTYKTLNGTSMAAPHVSGLAALIKCANRSMTPEEIRTKMTETALDLDTPGRDPFFGFGLVKAPDAVEEPGPDTMPPGIFFRSPQAGETVSGVVKIEILAQDLSGVANLKLIIDRELVGEWSSPPYVYYWDTTGLQLGPHSFTVEAIDGSGNTGRAEQEVNVGVNVSIFEPRDGFVVKDDVIIKAFFSDNAVVVESELHIDGVFREKRVPLNNQAEFFWNSKEVSLSGTSAHVLSVTALTTEGLKTSGAVNVIIRNPAVSIVLPEANSIVGGAPLQVTAHATDKDGIEKIEFFVDQTLADTVFSRPYQTELDPAGLNAGNHQLKAVAYSNTAHVAQSGEVIIKKPATVKFLSPLEGTVISGRYDVTVQFSEPVNSAGFLVNGSFLGGKSVNGTGPVTWTIDTTGYPDLSTAVIRCNAYTVKDQVLSTKAVNVTIDNYKDLAVPAVRIVAPKDGHIIDKPVLEIMAEASDDIGISHVEFYLDEAPFAKVLSPPYSATYDFTPVPAGRHYLTAKAEDAAGNSGMSAKVSIDRPATVTIEYPADNSTISENISGFRFLASDQVFGPVRLDIDNTLVHTVQIETPTTGPVTIPYEWDITGYPAGSRHTITIGALTYKDGIPLEATITVTVESSVDTVPPAVDLSASQSGIVLGTVLFRAHATDNREIERVDFYINGSLATDQVFPFTYEWDSDRAQTGHYTFTAKAYDTSGNSGLSNVINLSVPTKVSVVSPVSNSHIVGGFNDFSAVFREPVAGSVSLYIDDQFKASTQLDSPVSGTVKVNYDWDTSVYPGLSQHQVKISAETARDGILSTGSTTVYVDNRSDLTPPVIRLSSSAYRIYPGDGVTLAADVSDNTGIKNVGFYREGTLLAALVREPFRLEWDSTGQPAGRNIFTARAYDYAGNSTVSNEIIVGIATAVSIVSPSDGQVVSGTVNSFAAQFNDPVSGYVYLYIDGERVAAQKAGTPGGPVSINYEWDTTLYVNESTHIIAVRGYTATGQVRSEGTVTVTIRN